MATTNWIKIHLLEVRLRWWNKKLRGRIVGRAKDKATGNRAHYWLNIHLKEGAKGKAAAAVDQKEIEAIRPHIAAWEHSVAEAEGEIRRLKVAIAALKPKPAPTPPAPKGGVQAIVSAARRACSEVREYEYEEVRPYPSSLFGSYPRRMDCSGFSILCYKAAGAPDPNGTGYDGYGNTYSLADKGWRVSGPEPGALAFYYDIGHVAVCLGDGMCANMGKPGEPVIEALWPGADEFRMYEV